MIELEINVLNLSAPHSQILVFEIRASTLATNNRPPTHTGGSISEFSFQTTIQLPAPSVETSPIH